MGWTWAHLWDVTLRLLLVPEMLVQVYLNSCVHYRPKNGKAELSRLGSFSSCLCILAVPASISAQSAFAVLWSTVHKAPRHPAHGGLAVHSVLVVWGRAKLRQRLIFPWQQQLELLSPACPSDNTYGIHRSQQLWDDQSLYPPFLSPCLGLGWDQA